MLDDYWLYETFGCVSRNWLDNNKNVDQSDKAFNRVIAMFNNVKS